MPGHIWRRIYNCPDSRQHVPAGNGTRVERTFMKYLHGACCVIGSSECENGQAFPAWQAPCRKNLHGTCLVSASASASSCPRTLTRMRPTLAGRIWRASCHVKNGCCTPGHSSTSVHAISEECRRSWHGDGLVSSIRSVSVSYPTLTRPHRQRSVRGRGLVVERASIHTGELIMVVPGGGIRGRSRKGAAHDVAQAGREKCRLWLPATWVATLTFASPGSCQPTSVPRVMGQRADSGPSGRSPHVLVGICSGWRQLKPGEGRRTRASLSLVP